MVAPLDYALPERTSSDLLDWCRWADEIGATTYDPAPWKTLPIIRNIRAFVASFGPDDELTEWHAEIEDFVAEKLKEGFSLADINELYSVEIPLMPAVDESSGKVKVRWPFNILER